jgi:hypothetical protein
MLELIHWTCTALIVGIVGLFIVVVLAAWKMEEK